MAAAVQTMPAQTENPNGGPDAYFADLDAPVQLNRLQPRSEKIDCPHCSKQTHTRVEKTGVKGQGAMNFLFWPLPNRKHWFEWTHWYCKNCNNEVAKQKYGQTITPLPPARR